MDTLEAAGRGMTVKELAAALGVKKASDVRRRYVARPVDARVVEFDETADTVWLRADWGAALEARWMESGEMKWEEDDRRRYDKDRNDRREWLAEHQKEHEKPEAEPPDAVRVEPEPERTEPGATRAGPRDPGAEDRAAGAAGHVATLGGGGGARHQRGGALNIEGMKPEDAEVINLAAVNREYDVRAVGTVMGQIGEVVLRALGKPPEEGDDWLSLRDVVGRSYVPPGAAETIQAAMSQAQKSADMTEQQRWQTLEFICGEYLAGAISDEAERFLGENVIDGSEAEEPPPETAA